MAAKSCWRSSVERQAAGLDLGVIEHRVDQFHQVLVRVFDEIDVILVVGSAASNSAKPMMAFRGAQFVAHARDEFGFGAARAFRRVSIIVNLCMREG